MYGDTLPRPTSGVTELAGERQRRAHLLTHTHAQARTHTRTLGVSIATAVSPLPL